MSKVVIGISAGITAFILALTAGAVYAYRITAQPGVTVQQQQPSSQPAAQVATSLELAAPPAAPAAPNVSPQDAASIAAKTSNRTDLYSVELADYQGTQAYKVTFSSGDVVYIGLDGKYLGTEAPPAPVFVTQSGGGGGNYQGSHSKGSDSGGYEEHDDHEGGGD